MTIVITREQILRVAPKAKRNYLDAFDYADKYLTPRGINTNPLRLAHFLGTILHETGGLAIYTESFNYSVKALMDRYVPERMTEAQAKRYGRTASQRANQEAIGNTIYGGEWGRENLGNTQTGDGYALRGHGMAQLTGRSNFADMSLHLSANECGLIDLTKQPELTYDPRYALLIPAVFWTERSMNAWADKDDFRAIRRKWNGGYNGLEDVILWTRKVKSILEV